MNASVRESTYCAKCLKGWGTHDPPYVEEEWEIKNYCVICGTPMEVDKVRYLMDGNYCRECSARQTLVSLKRITFEEANKEIQNRIQTIKKYKKVEK